ncbi:hypothetical protein PAMA_007550 [Pampus argenteus]
MVELTTKMLGEFASVKQQTSKELELTDSEDEDDDDPEVLVEKPKALKGKPTQDPILAIVEEVIEKTVCEITEPLLHCVEDSAYERLQSEFSCEIRNEAKEIAISIYEEFKRLAEKSNLMPKDMQLNQTGSMIRTLITKCLTRISLHHMVVQLERKFDHKAEAKTMGTLIDYLFEYEDGDGPSVFPRYKGHGFSNSLEIIKDLTDRIYSCIKYGTMKPTTKDVDDVLYEDTMQKVCCFMAVTQWWHNTQADIHTDRVMVALKDANVEDEEKKKNEIKYLVKKFVTRLYSNSKVEFTLENVNNIINRLSEKIWDELQGTKYRMNIVTLVSLDTFVLNELLKWRSAADLVVLINLRNPGIEEYITSFYLGGLIGLNNTHITEKDRKMVNLAVLVQNLVNRLYNNSGVKWTPTFDDLLNIITRLFNHVWEKAKTPTFKLNSKTVELLDKVIFNDLVKKWCSADDVLVLVNLEEPIIDEYITYAIYFRLRLAKKAWRTTEVKGKMMNIMFLAQRLVTRLYNNSKVEVTITQECDNIKRLFATMWCKFKDEQLKITYNILHSIDKTVFNDLVKKWHSAANVVAEINSQELQDYITSCFYKRLIRPAKKGSSNSVRKALTNIFRSSKIKGRARNNTQKRKLHRHQKPDSFSSSL